MSTNPKLIEAILTNNKLTEEEKSKLISEFIESIQTEFPELKYHATTSDVKEVELKLTKEIEVVRKEIKEVELKLTKEIEVVRKEINEIELKLTKEIEVVRKEINEVELKLTKEIEDIKKDIEVVRKEIKDLELRLVEMIEKSKNTTIKWVVGIMFAQLFSIAGIVFAAFKLFGIKE